MRPYVRSHSFITILSCWLVQHLFEPLFGKEGYGEIYGEEIYSKNPPQSPFAKGGRCKSERFPTSGNDINVALLIAALVLCYARYARLFWIHQSIVFFKPSYDVYKPSVIFIQLTLCPQN